MKKIVTRFAPSPTGYLHIGSLRTVLFNFLFTRKNHGRFLLRIEDTDRTRYVEGSIENMIGILKQVGLEPDEGPNNPGEVGPYLQSERLDIYQKYITELLEKDMAYRCFCSTERLEELRKEQTELGLPTKYDKKCRYLTKEEIQEKINAGETYTIRLKVPDNQTVEFVDEVRGKISINTKEVDDQVLMKTDGFPTYHFAVVIDDHLMGVTDIIRGDEWIPSTPKHILLYDAFGWEAPNYSHVPPLVGADRKKLSKRTGDVAVEKYLEKGYLTESLMNFLALLGWNPKTTEEFFTMDELIKRFELKNIQRAGAYFDIERLDFFNSHYLKTLDSEYLYSKFREYLKKYDKEFDEKISSFDEEYNKKIFFELKTRIRYFGEFKNFVSFFYDEPKLLQKDILMNKKMKIDDLETVKKGFEIALDILNSRNSDFLSVDEIKNIFMEKILENNMKNGQVLWPVRCALSGEEYSPGALELIYILGVEESKKRIQNNLNNLA
ncbi:glutamate--tRNA ligase [Candidatus Gracilibacteria bacterium HOT-871]|nr:glutamate--tRNA ligase [Candidatus Gracilibacteria bacterium HOT-871]RKW25237.1 MAG: glutamate--tRNA ligase [Candidatus Gracilibacteria bacterium]